MAHSRLTGGSRYKDMAVRGNTVCSENCLIVQDE